MLVSVEERIGSERTQEHDNNINRDEYHNHQYNVCTVRHCNTVFL